MKLQSQDAILMHWSIKNLISGERLDFNTPEPGYHCCFITVFLPVGGGIDAVLKKEPDIVTKGHGEGVIETMFKCCLSHYPLWYLVGGRSFN